MSTIDRRAFLRGLAIASAAAAASALSPGVFFAEGSDGRAATSGRIVWRKTPCRFCGVGCGLLVGIENGRAVAVKGDPESPVSRGLACVKGYHSVQALYGRDRITRALVRRNGELVPVPIQEALDLVAQKINETIAQHGKDSVAIYGSGQWTVADAYVATKLFKGALGTNNVETNVRLSAGSGMAGAIGSFGLDGAVGCFDDIEHADVFVLWDANLAETHPVLFSRLLERRRTSPAVQIVDVASRTTRTSYAADRSLIFAPQSDLALANALCHLVIARRWANREFVEKHVAFKRGTTRIGYGLSGDIAGGAGMADDPVDVNWNDYVRFLAAYTPERAEQISGVPAADVHWLASLYGDRSRKVMSLWTSDLNQHTRGTWMNNLIHNLHLLVGKIATPGNAPFCLIDQPNGSDALHGAGALTDRLPGGQVTQEEDRERAARIWGVPVEGIDGRPTHHALSMFRALERGEIRFMWIQGTNPMVSLPNVGRFRSAVRKADRFVVVSEVYPTPTTDIADVVLPAAMWLEREGIFGNSERRSQHFEQMIDPPGDATSDARQLIEVAQRLGFGKMFPWDDAELVNGTWAELLRFHPDPHQRPATLAELRAAPGLIWPLVDGRETRRRYNSAHDPAASAERGAYDFYGHADHRAWIWLRPYEPPAESPDTEYPFWLATGRVLEHWGTGSMTRRIPTLHRAVPRAYVEMNPQDARALGIRNGETVRLVSRRGSLAIEAKLDHRSQPPRGQLFVPSFDESLPVNLLTLDASCPISGQPDYGKCAVRIERAAVRTGR
jgi:nitrate reductase (cytochrome)